MEQTITSKKGMSFEESPEYDKVFKECVSCKQKFLHKYWDYELEHYISLAEENQESCWNCR